MRENTEVIKIFKDNEMLTNTRSLLSSFKIFELNIDDKVD